jgi:hypothetical protein
MAMQTMIALTKIILIGAHDMTTRDAEIHDIHIRYLDFYKIGGGLFLVLVGVTFGAWIFGYNRPMFTDTMLAYITNVWTELLSVIATILVLDRLNERRARQKYKQDLIRQAGSVANSVAVDAVEQLNKEGWLIGAEGVLKGLDLHGANLANARLESANLENINLRTANLSHAQLRAANLQQANLGFANLEHGHLWFANLQEAHLRYANLQQASLNDANLQQANLRDASLQQANLQYTNLQKADLREADMVCQPKTSKFM